MDNCLSTFKSRFFEEAAFLLPPLILRLLKILQIKVKAD